MAQLVKVLAIKPNNLSLIPRTNRIEEEPTSSTTCPLTSTHVPMHTCPYNNVYYMSPAYTYQNLARTILNYSWNFMPLKI